MSKKKLIGKSTKLAGSNMNDEITTSDISQHTDGALRNISVDMIRENPHQTRKFFDPDKMDELTQSVRESGIIQPIIVRFEGEDIYLVAGERRLRAARAADLKKIPAILTEGDPAHITLIENIQRENLKPVEEAEAMAKLIDERGYTQDQLARIIGKAKSTISETLSINKLPEVVKDEVRRGENYPKRMLIEVVRQETTEKMIALFEQAKGGKLTSDEVKNITHKRRSRRAPAAIASEKINTLQRHLKKIKPGKLDDHEKGRLLTGLKNLEDIITVIRQELEQN
ncbi:ParB/RepB/Spo0J family partition protein [Desulfococcaceae bacterium HSG8]|nr:ParB/RepB/Spo0J family partition protein [Desulfococcaceae bacterium HSG8]